MTDNLLSVNFRCEKDQATTEHRLVEEKSFYKAGLVLIRRAYQCMTCDTVTYASEHLEDITNQKEWWNK